MINTHHRFTINQTKKGEKIQTSPSPKVVAVDSQFMSGSLNGVDADEEKETIKF